MNDRATSARHSIVGIALTLGALHCSDGATPDPSNADPIDATGADASGADAFGVGPDTGGAEGGDGATPDAGAEGGSDSGIDAKGVPPSFFGMHIHDHAKFISSGAPLPLSFGSFRLWDTQDAPWNVVETSRKVYAWQALDDFVAAAQAHGLELLYEVARVPTWASSMPTMPVCPMNGSAEGCCSYADGACAPPCDFAPGTTCPDGSNASSTCFDGSTGNCIFKEFLTALVQRYKGKIHAYELWNEPHNPWYWFSGTANGGTFTYDYPLAVANLVKMNADAFAILRKNDPSASIVAPSGAYGVRNQHVFMKDYWATWFGNPNTAVVPDVISFHFYDPGDGNGDTPENVVGRIKEVRDVIAPYAPLISKPIQNTEGSFGDYAKLTPAEQTGYVARRAMLMLDNDIARFYWYAFDGGGLGLLYDTAHGKLANSGVAYQQVHDWLVGAARTGPCSLNGGTVLHATYTCDLSRPGGYVARMVWNTDGDAVYSLSSHVFSHYRDLAGIVHATGASVPIGIAPILLENR